MKKKTANVAIFMATVLILSVALRLALFGIFARDGAVESHEYNEIAKNIIMGKGYTFHYLGTTYKSFAAPMLAFLISFIYRIFGVSQVPVIVFQIILSAATVVGCSQ